jgi:hypothetical protein
MAVPSSGELKLWDTLWNQELGGSKGENSLHSASIYAGFDTPDALSDFYGWSDVEVPAVSSSPASSIGSSTFVANGNVSSTGNENPTRGFYMGTNSGAYSSNPKYAIGTGGTGAFSRYFSGLSSQTSYYYWAFACNSAGEVQGGRITATTTAPPFSPSLATVLTSGNFAMILSGNASVGAGVYYRNPYTGQNNYLGGTSAGSPGGYAQANMGSAQGATNTNNLWSVGFGGSIVGGVNGKTCGQSFSWGNAPSYNHPVQSAGTPGFNQGRGNTGFYNNSLGARTGMETAGGFGGSHYAYYNLGSKSDIRLKINITYL